MVPAFFVARVVRAGVSAWGTEPSNPVEFGGHEAPRQHADIAGHDHDVAANIAAMRVSFRAVFAISCASLAFACTGSPGGTTPDETARASATPLRSADPLASAAASGSAEAPKAAPYAELDLDPQSFDFSKNPDLAERVAGDAHSYFRFVNRAFAASVCKRFENKLKEMPRVRLHGDPHIEQYAVTDLGRGLADFDDAAVGPPAIDLTRFATSAVLASRAKGFSRAEENSLISELFRGYRDGLKGTPFPAKPPDFAVAMMGVFRNDRLGFINAADNTMIALEQAEESFVRAEVAAYSKLAKLPKRAPGFFTIKKVGLLKLGIGSALVRKYLVRLEGDTPALEDDVLMEVKEVSTLEGVPCMQAIVGGAADGRDREQRAAGDKRLLVPRLLDESKLAPVGARRFWVNEWLANYNEAKIKKLKAADLGPLVYEAGLWLAAEHLRDYPGEKGPVKHPPADKLTISIDLEADIRKHANELADDIVRGWDRFKLEVARPTRAKVEQGAIKQ